MLVNLTGKSVDIMCEVSCEYQKFVGIENRIQVLYLKLKKVLYGLIQPVILCYNTFKNYLEGIGFKTVWYDPCIVNKILNGSQCTI